MRYKGLLPQNWSEGSIREPAVQAGTEREVVALYNDDTKTVYLPDGWTGHTPAELSVLVHEMVHHFQNIAGIRYECPMGREKLAYLAQSQWLSLSGLTLESEFGIDAMTVLVNTTCAIGMISG